MLGLVVLFVGLLLFDLCLLKVSFVFAAWGLYLCVYCLWWAVLCWFIVA